MAPRRHDPGSDSDVHRRGNSVGTARFMIRISEPVVSGPDRPYRDGPDGMKAQSAASDTAPNDGAVIAPRRCSALMNSRSKESATEPTTRSFASNASDHA